jgi:nicotinate-nucleotide pyrophosphorylase
MMPDNMTRDQPAKAMAVIGSAAMVEVFGGIDRENAADPSTLGIQVISVGALTRARTVDLSMRINPP